MSQPFVGEIRMMGCNFAPNGWAFCNGAIMAIAQNDVLYTLIGTTYGGDGQTTFGLPNLACRIPVHQGPGYIIGQLAGTETVTLTLSQLPQHTHTVKAAIGTGGSQVNSPAGNYWSGWTGGQYAAAPSGAFMNAAAISTNAGGSQPHENMPPFLAVNFVISLFGIFPSQN
jgi:microcystin-dependent protein